MNRRGFSLIELMIAMVILTVGVLGVAASARMVTQMTGWGGRYGGSAAVASSRFEILRASTCTTLAGGTATTGKYSESWTITTSTTSSQLKTVTLTLTYSNGNRTRSDVYTTQISCVPTL